MGQTCTFCIHVYNYTQQDLFVKAFYKFIFSHNHRPCRWLALAPLGHVTRLSLKARRKVCQPRDFYRHAPKGAFLFAPFYRLTRERVNKLFYAQLIVFIILLQLIPYVLLDCLFIASYCIYIVSSTPEMSIPIFIL